MDHLSNKNINQILASRNINKDVFEQLTKYFTFIYDTNEKYAIIQQTSIGPIHSYIFHYLGNIDILIPKPEITSTKFSYNTELFLKRIKINDNTSYNTLDAYLVCAEHITVEFEKDCSKFKLWLNILSNDSIDKLIKDNCNHLLSEIKHYPNMVRASFDLHFILSTHSWYDTYTTMKRSVPKTLLEFVKNENNLRQTNNIYDKIINIVTKYDIQLIFKILVENHRETNFNFQTLIKNNKEYRIEGHNMYDLINYHYQCTSFNSLDCDDLIPIPIIFHNYIISSCYVKDQLVKTKQALKYIGPQLCFVIAKNTDIDECLKKSLACVSKYFNETFS
jgi:hypothetical protein